jgi:polysaccharide deacetylase 2 family uncharacterized protein YibQ
MDEKLEHFVALLNARGSPVERSRKRPQRRPLSSSRVLVLAFGLTVAAGSGAAGLWFMKIANPLPAAEPADRAGIAAMEAVAPSAPPPATAVPPPVPLVAVGDEASLAPSTITVPSTPPEISVLPPATGSTPAQPPQELSGTPPPWQRYSVAAPVRDSRPRIVVVMDDLGLDRRRSERTMALPAPLTLSFLPYANDLPRQTDLARRAGHELLVHVPMEPFGHVADAGPNELDVALGRDEVLRRLRWDLGRFEGYVGINNHMGSRFTSDADALRPVIEELRARGLLFLDSRSAPHSYGVELAREIGVPNAGRDVFLDDEITVPAVEAQLAELERVARRNGTAIAIGHPHDPTIEVLDRWLRTLPQKGLVLVPLSATVRTRAGVSG